MNISGIDIRRFQFDAAVLSQALGGYKKRKNRG
jgi:hypothetical protein